MRQIVEQYERQDSDYVFPMLRGESSQTKEPGASELLHKKYLNSLRRYNYNLHRLSEMMGLDKSLSSYVVRHSWASLAYLHHLDIGLIGKALGHTKSSTTLIYIKSLFDEDLASANQTLMEEIGL